MATCQLRGRIRRYATLVAAASLAQINPKGQLSGGQTEQPSSCPCGPLGRPRLRGWKVLRRTALLAASAVLVAASCSGTSATPYSAEATTGGFTVVYAKTNPNKTDPPGGPCAGVAPTTAVKQMEKGLGGFECNDEGLDVHVTDVGAGRIAVWGLLLGGITSVEVASTRAVSKGHTYLAVIETSEVNYEIRGLDASGKVVDTLSSTELPPPVPIVTG